MATEQERRALAEAATQVPWYGGNVEGRWGAFICAEDRDYIAANDPQTVLRDLDLLDAQRALLDLMMPRQTNGGERAYNDAKRRVAELEADR